MSVDKLKALNELLKKQKSVVKSKDEIRKHFSKACSL